MSERSMDQVSDTCNKACDILKLTNDGDDLDPMQLSYLESAVNGFLTEEGLKVFNELHRLVTTGQYKKPPFHGIENLSIDQVGYVYWKGKCVEHYTLSWSYSEEAHKAALELARRCKLLEEKGITPDTNSAIWNWAE